MIRVAYTGRPELDVCRKAIGPFELVALGSDCDLGVSIGGSHIFTPDEIDRARCGIVNLHFAPLPEFRGRFAAGHAIRLGESMFGATLHYVDAGIDTGPVIAQHLFAIDPGDGVDSLRARAFAAGVELWLAWAPFLVARAAQGLRLPAWKQDEARARYFTLAMRP